MLLTGLEDLVEKVAAAMKTILPRTSLLPPAAAPGKVRISPATLQSESKGVQGQRQEMFPGLSPEQAAQAHASLQQLTARDPAPGMKVPAPPIPVKPAAATLPNPLRAAPTTSRRTMAEVPLSGQLAQVSRSRATGAKPGAAVPSTATAHRPGVTAMDLVGQGMTFDEALDQITGRVTNRLGGLPKIR